MNKKLIICLSLIGIFAGGSVAVKGFFEERENSKIFDYDSQTIITNYAKEVFPTSLVRTAIEDTITTSYSRFCGVDAFYDLDNAEAQSLNVSLKKKSGEVKLISVDVNTNAVSTIFLEAGSNIIPFPSGTYEIYIIGKWFSGRLEVMPEEA